MSDLKDRIVDQVGTRLEVYRRVACRVCLFVGPVFLGLALVFLVSTLRFLHRCVPATGMIVQLLPETDHGDNSVAYRPIFRFIANDGKTYEVRSHSASNPPAFTVGQAAGVLYEPSHPMEAKLNWFWDLWGMTLVLAIIGGFASTVGLVLRIYQRWLDRRGLSITPRDSAHSIT